MQNMCLHYRCALPFRFLALGDLLETMKCLLYPSHPYMHIRPSCFELGWQERIYSDRSFRLKVNFLDGISTYRNFEDHCLAKAPSVQFNVLLWSWIYGSTSVVFLYDKASIGDDEIFLTDSRISTLIFLCQVELCSGHIVTMLQGCYLL